MQHTGYHTWDPKKQGEARRPFRLWDANRKKNMRSRNYGTGRNAHNAALLEVRWARVGESIEVYDVRNGKLLGTYTRRVRDILFMNGQAPL